MCSCGGEPPPKPVLVLWALDRPEKLPFVDPNVAEVAVLRGTISLSAAGVLAQPRQVSFEAPSATKLTSVMKIDAGRFDGYVPTDGDAEKCSAVIKNWANRASSTSIQIDFDAGQAQRPFYRSLLRSLRPAFPRVTIAAPAAWCTSDPWVNDLPVDEVIPMLFRMGAQGGSVLDSLSGAGDFSADLCKGHYGFSMDERLSFRPPASRIYAFNPRPWDDKAYRDALAYLPK